MWSRVLGLAADKQEKSPAISKKRNDDNQPQRKRTESTATPSSARKPSQSDDRDRGFNPTSTSYSSTSRSPYPGAASASVASSYATAQSNNIDAPIAPPDLVRNPSLAHQMPKKKSVREEQDRGRDRDGKSGPRRDRSSSRDRKGGREDRSRSRDREERKKDRRDKRDKKREREAGTDRGLESEYKGTSRAGEVSASSGSFNGQIGAVTFTQFPGQYDGAMIGPSTRPPHQPVISDHVPDQFPGQFPSGASAPYRPPLSVDQGGPGLAADYYGDTGESVAQQPGVRPQAPSLIVGAEPHLMAASPIAAPPVEPSATGGVGAAASFFSGASFESPSATPTPCQQAEAPARPPQQSLSFSQPGGFAVPAVLAGSAAVGYMTSTHGDTSSAPRPPYTASPSTSVAPAPYTLPPTDSDPAPYTLPPTGGAPVQFTLPPGAVPSGNNYHSVSAPIIPSLGSAAVGAAAGYMIGSHASQQHQSSVPLSTGGPSGYEPLPSQQPFAYVEVSHGSHSWSTRPPKAGKSSVPSKIPVYAAAAAGAAGLAATAAYHDNHQNDSQSHSQSQNQSHSHAQQQASYTGRPHASTTMAQQHRHDGPLDKFVDFFRDREGVARFEEYTEYIGVCRYCFKPGSSPRDAPRKHHYRKRRSNERLGASMRVDKESRYGVSDGENRRKKNDSWLATGLAGYGLAKVGKALFAADSDDDHSARTGHAYNSTTSLHGPRYSPSPSRRSSTSYGITRKSSDAKSYRRSRSRSRNRKSDLAEAAVGAATRASAIASSSQSNQNDRRSHHSPKEETGVFGAFSSSPPEPKQRRNSHNQPKMMKKNGFFSFNNSSSSSGDLDLVAGTGSDRSRRKKASKTRIKDHNDASAALIGLGAAAAALAAVEGRKSDKSKRRTDGGKHNHPAPLPEENIWVDASEDDGYSSVDPLLAYGVSKRRSQESLSSDSSGTNIWGLWWGRKPEQKKKKKKQAAKSHIDPRLGVAGGLAGVTTGAAVLSHEDHRDPAIGSSGSLPPLQHVHPISTSDPAHYDVTRRDFTTSATQPYQTPRPSAIPLQQPRPVAPISSVIYTSRAPYEHAYSAPAGPPIFAPAPQPLPYTTGHGIPPQGYAPSAANRDVGPIREIRRRDTSPSTVPAHIEPEPPKRASTDLSSVGVDFSGKRGDKKSKEGRQERTKSDSSGRERDRKNSREGMEAVGSQSRSKKRSTDTTDEKAKREEEIDRILERLRKEEAEASKKMKKSRDSWVTPELASVAGAVVGVATAMEISKSDGRQERSREEGKDQRVVDDEVRQREEAIPRESDEKQTARTKPAAALKRRTVSPTVHESYADFFVPAELQSKSQDKTPKDDSNGGNNIAVYAAPAGPNVEPAARGYPSAGGYSFDGGESDLQHMKSPWPVPELKLTQPTPPASMAGSVRSDASPLMRPEDRGSSDDERPGKEAAKEPPKGKVTFGESETREFEVITPYDHRDEFIGASHEIPKDHEETDANPRGNEINPTVVASPLEEIKRDRIPGQFDDDIDFAATLAAGVEASGFDPAIVINNPTYHRRDSPPGSNSTGFYQAPFYDTVTDLGLDSPGTEGAPPVRGFVEGEIPPTPKEEAKPRKDDAISAAKNEDTSALKYGVTSALKDDVPSYMARPLTDEEAVRTGRRTEKNKAEAEKTKAKDQFFVPLSSMSRNPPKFSKLQETNHPYSQEPEIIEAAPRSIPRQSEDFKLGYIVSTDHKPTPQPRAQHDESDDTSESQRGMSKDPKLALNQKFAADIPLPENDDDELTSTPKSEIKLGGRRSAGDGDEYDSAENASATTAVVSLPDDGDERRKHKKKSKRKSSGYYDDTASVASAPAKYDESTEVTGKSKKEKRGGVFGLFGRSTESAPEREATRDDFDEPKRKGSKKSKDRKSERDSGDFYSQPSESIADLPRGVVANLNGHSGKSSKTKEHRSSKGKDERRKSLKAGKTDGDLGRATQELPAKNLHTPDEELDLISEYENDPGEGTSRAREKPEPLSFLGVRREETEPPDLAGLPDPGGSASRRLSIETVYRDSLSSKIIEESLPPLPPSRPTTPTAVGSLRDLPPLPHSVPASPAATPTGQRRRMSMLQLSESGHAMSSPSPTAVPLMFRRFPTSGVSRSSPSTPGQSPQALTILSPRNRQGRPLSTEFKSSKEFRPLWLVERHAGEPSRRKEVSEEVYPSLPSSHSNSRASSVYNSEQDDVNDLLDRWTMDEDSTLHHEPPVFDERELDYRPDLLDSQQPTPTKDSFKMERANEDAHHTRRSSSVSEGPLTQPSELEGPWFKYGWEDPRELPSLPNSSASSTYDEPISHDMSSRFQDTATDALAAVAALTATSTLHHDQEREHQAQPISPPEHHDVAKGERNMANLEAGIVQPVVKPFAENEPPTVVQDLENDEKASCIDGGDQNRGDSALSPIVAAPEPMPLADNKEDTLIDEQRSVEEEAICATPEEWPASITEKEKRDKKGEKSNRGMETPGALDTPVQEPPAVSDIPGAFPETPGALDTPVQETPAISDISGAFPETPGAFLETPGALDTPVQETPAVSDIPGAFLETPGALDTPVQETPAVSDIPGAFQEEQELAEGPEDYFQNSASSKKGKKGRKGKGKSASTETPEVSGTPSVIPDVDTSQVPLGDWPTSSKSKKGKKGKTGKLNSHEVETDITAEFSKEVPDEPVAAVDDWTVPSTTKKGKKGKKSKGRSQDSEIPETPDMSEVLAEELVIQAEGVDDAASRDLVQNATKAHNEPHDKEPERLDPMQSSEDVPNRTVLGTIFASAAAAGAAFASSDSKKEKKRKGKKEGMVFEEEPANELLESQAVDEAQTEQSDLPPEASQAIEQYDEPSIGEPRPAKDLPVPIAKQEPSTFSGVPDVAGVKSIPTLQEDQEEIQQLEQREFKETIPADIELPTDDDLDLLPPLPGSPIPEPVEPSPSFRGPHFPNPTAALKLQENQESPWPSTQPDFQEATPADIQLPLDHDLDLLPALPDSPIREPVEPSPSFGVPDVPNPTAALKLQENQESPWPSKQPAFQEATPADIQLPLDHDLDFLPALPDSPTLELQIAGEVDQASPSGHHPLMLQEHFAETYDRSELTDEVTPREAQPSATDLEHVFQAPVEGEAALEDSVATTADATVQSPESQDPYLPELGEVNDDASIYSMKAPKNGKKSRKSLPVTSVIKSLPEEPEATRELTEALEIAAHASLPENFVHEPTIAEEEILSRDVDDGSVYAVKKGKKGKKSRKSLPVTPLIESLPQEPEAAQHLTKAPETAYGSLPESSVQEQTLFAEDGMALKEQLSSKKNGKKGKKQKLALDDWPIGSSQLDSSESSKDLPAETVEEQFQESELITPRDDEPGFPVTAEKGAVDRPSVPTSIPIIEPTPANDSTVEEVCIMPDYPYEGSIVDPNVPEDAVVLLAEGSLPSGDKAESEQLFSVPKSKKDKKKRKNLSRSESSSQNAIATMEPLHKTVRTLEPLAEKVWPLSSENLLLNEASKCALPDDNDNDLLMDDAGEIELLGEQGIDVPQVQKSMTALPAEGSEILAMYQRRAPTVLDLLDEAVQTPLPQDDRDDYLEVQKGVRELELAPQLNVNDAAGLAEVSWLEPEVTKPEETTSESPLPNSFDEAVCTPLPQDDQDEYLEPHQAERELQSNNDVVRNNASSLPQVTLREPEVTKSVEPSVEPSHERISPGQDLAVTPQQQSYFPHFDPIQIPLPEDQQEDYFDPQGSEGPGEDFISDFNPSEDSPLPLSEDVPRELHTEPPVEDTADIAPANSPILSEDSILPAELTGLHGDLEEPDRFNIASPNKKEKKNKKKRKSKASERSEDVAAEGAQERSVSEPADDHGIVTKSLSVIGGLVAGSAVARLLDSKTSKKDKKKKGKSKAIDREEESAEESAQEQSTAELGDVTLGDIHPVVMDELSVTQDEPPATVEEPRPADDNMGFPSFKKGKKGKKKGKSLAPNWDEEPAVEAERRIGAEPPMSAEMEPPALLLAEVDKPTAGSEDSEIVTFQKSRKDKRKSNSTSARWEEDAPAQNLQPEPEPNRSTGDSSYKPVPVTMMDEAAPVADVSEFSTSKESKKDKQKTRASAIGFDKDSSTQEMQTNPEPESAKSVEKSFNEPEPTLTVGEAAPRTDDPDSFISKRSKKDKRKGKKGQVFDWNDESTGTTTPALSETVPLSIGTDDVNTDLDANGTAMEAAAAEPEATEFFNLKKSKKDKKAKKNVSMALDDEPEQTPTLGTVDSTDKDRALFVPEENLTEVPFVQPNIDALPEEEVSKEVETDLLTPAPQDELEPEGSGYFSLKKSKKDKKKAKKVRSMAWEEDVQPVAAPQEIVSTDKDRAIFVPEQQLAEVPFQQPSTEELPQHAPAEISQDEYEAPATDLESIREDELHRLNNSKHLRLVPETIAPDTGRDLRQEVPSFAEDPSLDVSGAGTEQGTVNNDDFGGFAVEKEMIKTYRNARQAESTNTRPDIETPVEERTTLREVESTRNSPELFGTPKATPVLDERGAPASQDDFLDVGAVKRKKSKKSKKQAPVIWEDGTTASTSMEIPMYADEGVARPYSQPLETLYENEPSTPLESIHQDHVSPSDPVHRPDLGQQVSEDAFKQTLKQGQYTIPSLEDILREEDAVDQKDYDPAAYDEIRKQAFERELEAATREDPIVQEPLSRPPLAQDGSLRVVTDQLLVSQAEKALGMSRSRSRIGKHRTGDHSPAGRRSSASSSSRSLGLLPGDIEHSPHLLYLPRSHASPETHGLLPCGGEHAPSPRTETDAQGLSLSEEASLDRDRQAKETPIDDHPFHVERNSADQSTEHETVRDRYREESPEPLKSSKSVQGREPTEPSHDIERQIPVDVTPGKQAKNSGRAAAIVPSVGAGVALFENLARKNSVTENEKGRKRSGVRRSDLEGSNRRQSSPERAEESHDATRALSSTQDPPAIEVHKTRDDREPSTLSRDEYRPITSSPRVSSLRESSDRNRDSAVHVSDSPVPGDLARFHHSMRDSGYQGTEASPTFRNSLDKAGQYREYPTSGESFVNVRDPQDASLRDSGTTFESGTSMAESLDNPLNISIEVDRAYHVSISRPDSYGHPIIPSDVRDQNSEEKLPVQYQDRLSRDSVSPVRSYADSQPSLVDSSTKPRSSELFQSSPSTREDLTRTLPHEQTSPSNDFAALRDSSGSIDNFTTPTKKPAHQGLLRSRDVETTLAPTISLFGGPVGINSDLQSSISPPGTPLSSSRRQLNTISESSPEETTPQEHLRASPDMALPNDGLRKQRRSGTPQNVPERRVRSPLATTSEDKEPISIHDLDSRLSWPAVDEDRHSVDLERSKSRNTDAGRRTSSRHSQSPLPPLATDIIRQHDTDYRSVSGASIRSNESITAIIKDQGTRSPSTPPLRRVDRSVSSDLRAANKRSEAKKAAKSAEADPDLEPAIASSSTYDPLKDKGKARITKMADVYEGWGDVNESPRSPTRPTSMRKRQSMQFMEMQTRLDQLALENRSLIDAKTKAERNLEQTVHDHNELKEALTGAIDSRDQYLKQKDLELGELKRLLEGLHDEVSRLTEVNESLQGSTRDVASGHEQRYNKLESEHTEVHQRWQDTTRELEDLRDKHASLSGGLEGIVQHEVEKALEGKNAELQQMRHELDAAKQQVRALQQEILAARSSDEVLVARDEDYFDGKCQELCQHVQQWVLRFSKFSDGKICHSISEVMDEKIADRFDNAILDGSDVDIYLKDRIRRRDVFMSVVMTMVWEYIFTRYLFGMDREQRQKLKSLEKTLSEVGPARSVNKWRATTLTMLAKRDAFETQRHNDTEAVVHEIYETLATLLTPPAHLVTPCMDSLRKVMSTAVDLSVEMRTQRAEYIMLPPLQPEYDTHGDLARQVFFNASLMNERSGDTTSNEELMAQQAVVRMVLFPLVVKKGDDDGVGEEEIVVCPAQVLVARDPDREEVRTGKKTVRMMNPPADGMEGLAGANASVQSFAPSSMDAAMGGRF